MRTRNALLLALAGSAVVAPAGIVLLSDGSGAARSCQGAGCAVQGTPGPRPPTEDPSMVQPGNVQPGAGEPTGVEPYRLGQLVNSAPPDLANCPVPPPGTGIGPGSVDPGC